MLQSKGTYAFVFSCAVRIEARIGALGTLRLAPGWYIYTGSAFGRGGLRARLNHHLTSTAAPHWHLDYLRPFLTPRQAWYTATPPPCEHAWAAACLALPGAEIPLPRFGASDCACPAHLFAYPQQPSFALFASRMLAQNPAQPLAVVELFDSKSLPQIP